jgi:ABC-type spermidine/putrescine transport system permease subunit I
MTSTAADGAILAPSAGQAEPASRRFAPSAILAVPGALLFLALFLGPLAFLLVFSFWQIDPSLHLLPVWNLDNYVSLVTVPTYFRTFVKTLVMAAAVTLAALAAALPFTYFLVRYVRRSWQRILLLAVIIPFWTSYLLRVYSWQAILGEKGVLNQALMGIGLIAEPSRLLIYNEIGVFIVLLYVYFPFAALALYASLERFDFSQLSAAQDLGARPDQAIRHVLLPQIRPGLITASIFVFIPILGEFLTPTLVGGTQGLLIANLMVTFFRQAQYPQAASIAMVIAIFAVALLIVFRKHLRVEDVVRG